MRGMGANLLRVGIRPISGAFFVSFSCANPRMVMMCSCHQSCTEQTPVRWEFAQCSVLQRLSPAVLPLHGSADAKGETPCTSQVWALQSS